MAQRMRIAVLLSGGGTTLQNLIRWRDAGDLMADIDLVISSRPGAKGVTLAMDAGIETRVVDSKKFALAAREGETIRDWAAMSRELDRILLDGGYDLVCMAGFLCRYIFDERLQGKVVNIHPSLIPMFCGQGMHGHHVHEHVVAAGVKVTGCTVHFADHTYDTGPIIIQRCCPVFSTDTPEDVAERVFREECRAYPEAINLLAQGSVHFINDRRAFIDGDRFIERFSHDVD
jgi:phosphoribosylglycinamide formyltransferase-1